MNTIWVKELGGVLDLEKARGYIRKSVIIKKYVDAKYVSEDDIIMVSIKDSDIPDKNRYYVLIFEECADRILKNVIGDILQNYDEYYYRMSLQAANAIVAVSQVQFLPNHETVLMGSAFANSRKLFTIFKLHVDAQGNILSRDIRDFTTHATYRYDKVLDTFGNLYAVTRDTDAYPIAVVPFEDLPAHDDPGLILE